MTFWRQAGLNYIQYSKICAQIVRRSLKPEKRIEALKRDESSIKITPWRDGKPIKAQAN